LVDVLLCGAFQQKLNSQKIPDINPLKCVRLGPICQETTKGLHDTNYGDNGSYTVDILTY